MCMQLRPTNVEENTPKAEQRSGAEILPLSNQVRILPLSYPGQDFVSSLSFSFNASNNPSASILWPNKSRFSVTHWLEFCRQCTMAVSLTISKTCFNGRAFLPRKQCDALAQRIKISFNRFSACPALTFRILLGLVERLNEVLIILSLPFPGR